MVNKMFKQRPVLNIFCLGLIGYFAIFSTSDFVAGRALGSLLAIGLLYGIEKIADYQDKKPPVKFDY